MNTLFDYYVMLNYIIYNFFLRHEKVELDARLTSHLLTSLLLSLPLSTIHGFMCKFSPEFKLASRQCDRWVYAIPLFVAMLLNYLILYRNGRYKEEFMELDKTSDTEEFVKRKRNTKIFMIALVVIQVISVIHWELRE
ncbi:MAG: hypothetical protein MJZ34_01565 [Paludibacteraceae bacterium]|nr:hypothetical protein [Paludibacteraceae bacterium]